MWESVPVGWIPEPKAEPKPLIEELQDFEMPKLKAFELSDEARAQFLFNVDDLDSTPSPFYRKRPTYPQQLRRENIEGRVVAEFRVDRKGQTHQIKIIESDHPDFSASVVEALLNWRFMPGLVDGEPVEFRMRIPMVFRIVTSEPEDQELFFASVD
jgi:TonB family protein